MNRRRFLTATMTGAAALGANALMRPAASLAQGVDSSSPIDLRVVSRNIEVHGRSARVFGLLQAAGRHGLVLEAGSNFDVRLANEIGEATMIHWHGLTPPWQQDGVPDNPKPLLGPSDVARYTFPVGAGGTHWMHAHTLQEQNLLAAPLIVRTAADLAGDEQEVIVLLHDFSFKPAGELLAKLKGGGGHAAPTGHSAMGHGGTAHGPAAPTQPMAKDLNDIDYDAYLANDRTLDDPEVIRVENGGRVRLRIINGATATGFTIDTGSVSGTLFAVDGREVEPIVGSAFPISMGQRLDIRLLLPAGPGAYPVLARREGAGERTGVILATRGASVRRVASNAESVGPIVELDLERKLRALHPLPARAPDRRFALTLTGQMQDYTWGIDGADGLRVRRGERVEITMRNSSTMSHPMHLHGHHFQVTAIDGIALPGAMRDTVLVPPGSAVTIAFDSDNPGRWPLHCHHLYHMATGMMAQLAYEGIG
ncbi:multicopper oxidase family protein [Bosea beijingensis]